MTCAECAESGLISAIVNSGREGAGAPRRNLGLVRSRSGACPALRFRMRCSGFGFDLQLLNYPFTRFSPRTRLLAVQLTKILLVASTTILMWPQLKNPPHPSKLKMKAHLALCVLFSLAVAHAQPIPQPSDASRAVGTEMRNVMYHFTNHIEVHIKQLKGKLVPKKEIPVFDDKESFILEIDAATISMSTDSLSHVLNDHVFAGKDAPLKDLRATTEGNQLKIKGKLARKGGVSFEVVGELQVTPEGKIRLHARHIKAAHLPVKGLMDLFDVKLADLINTKKVQGVSTEKDDIILDPDQILPPPQIRGKLTGITVENGQITQVFGAGTAPARFTGARNFMAYRGAALRFGKLTMNDTDLVLIDQDAKDPFDFYLDHYRDQLVAGYTKTTPQFGLRVYMVDFNKLHQAKSKPPGDNAAAGR